MDNVRLADKKAKLKNRIMRRVYAMWLFRKIASPAGIEILSFSALLLWTSLYVSYINVLANAKPVLYSPYSAARFFAYAFWSTEFVEKLLFAALLLLFSSFVVSIARNLWKVFSDSALLKLKA